MTPYGARPLSRTLEPDDRLEHARRLWALADAHCEDCADYHRLRGILYLAGVNNGPRHDETALVEAIEAGLGDRRRVLIAAAADAELVGILIRPVAARPLEVTVVDRCRTPLTLIDQLRLPPGITVTTRVGDLTRLDDAGRHDLILSHSMIHFLAAEQRAAFLSGLRSALAPEGRLVITAPKGHRLEAGSPEAFAQAWLARAVGRIEACPAVTELFGEAWREPMARYAEAYARRQSTFSGHEAAQALLEAHGFVVEQRWLGSIGQAGVALGTTGRNNIFLARAI